MLKESSPKDDVQPWSSATRVVEELLADFHRSRGNPTVRVYVEGTRRDMEHRRRFMGALVRRHIRGAEGVWGVSVIRLDPHQPGGVNRRSTWEIRLVKLAKEDS